MNIDDVWSMLCSICKFEENQKEENIVYCAIALNEFSAILKPRPSERAVIACGLLAYYYYRLLGGQESTGDIAFEAGDVSVKLDGDKTDTEDLRKLAYKYASDDIEREIDFSFKAV